MSEPDGYSVEFHEPRRNDKQNRRFWAQLRDVRRDQGAWFGPGLDADDLKQIFMSALFRELRMARNADGDGFTPLVRRSSRLTVREMADLITLIQAWGDDPAHPVRWTDPDLASLAEQARAA